MNKTLVALAFLLATHAALASPREDALLNLFYFEHARLSADTCEQRGFGVRASYEDWRRTNEALHRQAVATVRSELAANGAQRAEQDQVLAAVVDKHRLTARDDVARRGVDCARFSRVLGMYSDLFKR